MFSKTAKVPSEAVRNWIYSHGDLKLRKLGRLDLPALLELKNESWVSRHSISFLNQEDQNQWFDSISGNTQTPHTLILVGMTEGDYGHDINVGIFKLTNIDWQSRRADAGWDIYPKHRGKGYGKKLVTAGCQFVKEVMGFHRLRAEILVTNEASRKCALAAGFVKEGVEREAVLRNGKWIDSEIYGVLFW
jgi:RimJ/RimL family protein N-acetyltransferase